MLVRYDIRFRYLPMNIHKMEVFEERSGIFNGRLRFMAGYRLPEEIRLKTEPNYIQSIAASVNRS